jgi:alkylated DNA nucleotide flippase Atl1
MRDNMSRTGPWITWLRVHDINKDGKLDITSENKQNQQEWLNTSGVFKGVIP